MLWRRRGLYLLACAIAATGCANAPFEADGTETDSTTQSLFSGATVVVYKDPNYAGTSYAFPVESGTFLSKDELVDVGLHDQISSARLHGVPKEASVYFFQDQGEGDYLRIEGADSGVPRVGVFRDYGMDNRTSSIWVADHGTGSLRVQRVRIQTELNKAILPRMPTLPLVQWRPIEVVMRPQSGLIEVEVSANLDVPAPARNKTVSMTLKLRPEIRGNSARIVYAGYTRDVDPCTLGVVCDPIKQALEWVGESEELIQGALGLAVNLQLAGFIRIVSAIPCPLGANVKPLHFNLAPGFAELVVAGSDADLSCLNNVITPLLPEDTRKLISTVDNRGNLSIRFGRRGE